jgi:hypothetical protein
MSKDKKTEEDSCRVCGEHATTLVTGSHLIFKRGWYCSAHGPTFGPRD